MLRLDCLPTDTHFVISLLAVSWWNVVSRASFRSMLIIWLEISSNDFFLIPTKCLLDFVTRNLIENGYLTSYLALKTFLILSCINDSDGRGHGHTTFWGRDKRSATPVCAALRHPWSWNIILGCVSNNFLT